MTFVSSGGPRGGAAAKKCATHLSKEEKKPSISGRLSFILDNFTVSGDGARPYYDF